jgi:hypothetical protein
VNNFQSFSSALIVFASVFSARAGREIRIEEPAFLATPGTTYQALGSHTLAAGSWTVDATIQATTSADVWLGPVSASDRRYHRIVGP